jgi:hypothetical protein
MTKIAGSVALAGAGPGFANSPSVFAATKSKGVALLASSLKRKPSAPSNCIDCSDYVELFCVYNSCDEGCHEL